jgi:hypothetical protein
MSPPLPMTRFSDMAAMALYDFVEFIGFRFIGFQFLRILFPTDDRATDNRLTAVVGRL